MYGSPSVVVATGITPTAVAFETTREYDEDEHPMYYYISAKAKKEGWLTKQGALVKNWKKRWFVLTENSLYYFADTQASESPKGCIKLLKGVSKVYESPNSVPDKPYYFELNPDPQAPNTRKYCLDAASDEDRKKWIRAIQDLTGTN